MRARLNTKGSHLLSIKVAVIGTGGVGKTMITTQFVRNEFSEHYDPTIEEFYQKQVEVNSRAAVLEITDTAGNDQFRMMREMYLGNSDAYVVVYSVVSKSSFLELPGMLDDIQHLKPDRTAAPVIVVGNKCDLPAAEREVTTDEGKELAQRYGCLFTEASARLNQGITELFMDLTKNLVIKRGTAIADKGKGKGKDKRKHRCILM